MDIRGKKSSKDMACSRNLVSTIGAQASPTILGLNKYFCKRLFKYNTRIDGESMQELATYLAHYTTGSWRNMEYDWPN